MRFSGAETLRRTTDWLMVAIVFAVVAACYWPALRGEILWDDPAHITSEDLRSWAGLWRIWFELGATQQYYPVLHTAFWIEHRLWGDSMVGYHLANIFQHAACCCLLALLLRRLWSMPETASARQPGLAWLAALLFAAHPVCVESVAWISEQKNTLSLLFYLLAALTYLDFAAKRRRRAYALATILFLLALGTKSVTATLPAAILVALWWGNGRLSWRRDAVPLLPWFGAAVAAGLFTAWVERTQIGARGASFHLSAMERVLLASRDVWFYLGKLAWPADLTFFYPRWDVAKEAWHWIGWLIASIVTTGLLFWIRRRARGPLAAWLLFVGSLFPALGFFNVYPFIFSYVADHFQYQACLVFVSAVAGGIAWLVARPVPWMRMIAGGCGGALVLGLAVVSRDQSGLYRDMATLFRHTVAAVPQSWMAHHNLGLALSRSRDGNPAAIAEYRKAIALNPSFPESHFALGRELAKLPEASAQTEAIREFERALEFQPYYPDANNALGLELAKQPGRLDEAIACFEKALQVRPKNAEFHLNLANALAHDARHLPEAMAHFTEAIHLRPDNAKAHNDYAVALAKLPDHRDEAMQEFEQALRLDPNYAEAHYNLAGTLAEMPGRASEAIAHYEQALKIDPDSAPAHYGLANVLALQAGRPVDAIAHYEAALRLQPDFAEAHANLANVLARMPGRTPAAIEHYEAALRIDPNLAWVHLNLGLHLAQIPGRSADAMAHYEAALRLKPDYPDALNGLAILCAQEGRFQEARAHWEKALEVDPNYQTARQNLRLLDQMAAQRR
ncbi:MAG TPA: tetratricopeptide repeat protein [Opitutus sp.]|nr:tetratricopeptide repeat protein [Opitutus sp.]